MNESLTNIKEIDAEFALSDALDTICQYLKIKDLINVSLVCKSWNLTASREMLKRGPERALLPHIFGKEFTEINSNFHVYDLLNSKPYVALLFIGPSLRERYNRSLEFEILTAYKKYFPRHLVAIGVDESIMDKNIITSCSGLLGPPNGILGLFLPVYRDLKIKVTSCTNNSYSAKRIINDLLPDDSQSKVTLIMFYNNYQGFSYITEIVNLIKLRFTQKMYTLWGGNFDDDLRAIDCKSTQNVGNEKTAIFALSISGSNLESWSVVIDCKIKIYDFDKKLLYLRNNLRLKRHTIGLVCGPRYVEDLRNTSYQNIYRNSHELMDAVKRIFLNISFIGIFNYGYHSHFGVDSMSDDCKQELSHQMSLSLMILTYD